MLIFLNLNILAPPNTHKQVLSKIKFRYLNITKTWYFKKMKVNFLFKKTQNLHLWHNFSIPKKIPPNKFDFRFEFKFL